MKGMDMFCASQASTAICSSVDHRSMVRHGHRRIDRKSSKPYHPPCSSQLPIIPRSYYEKNSGVKPSDVRRKSSADIHDLERSPGSSRYLLSDRPVIEWLSESSDRTTVSALVPSQQPAKHVSSNTSSPALKSSASGRSHDQVVVLRVSIHCKGCEGKIRKHISKMEGVTSFSIDLPTKKVTVIGDVTPSSVLESVSRVKSAQLWPSTTAPSHSFPMEKMNIY